MYSACNCYSKPKKTKLLGMFIPIVKLKIGFNTKTVNETFISYGVSHWHGFSSVKPNHREYQSLENKN